MRQKILTGVERRRREGLTEETGFLPVEMTAEKTVAHAIPSSPVEIVLMNGRRLRGIEGLSASGLAQLIRVLEGT